MDPEHPEPDSHARQRVSDADREAVVKLLNDAMIQGRLTLDEFDERSTAAFNAKVRGDFLPLTSDLLPVPLDIPDLSPDARPMDVSSRAPVPTARADVARVDGLSGQDTSVAIMGGVERKGVWHLSSSHTAVAIMGGVELDLREARLQSESTTINVFAFWGGVSIIVPPDVRVEAGGAGILGGFSSHTHKSLTEGRHPRAHAPVVYVNGVSIMGGVEVVRRA